VLLAPDLAQRCRLIVIEQSASVTSPLASAGGSGPGCLPEG
jgi:hypothetical protein